MRLCLAETSDLPELEAMYGGIVQKMEQDGIRIWDDVYPVCALGGDIERGQLYAVRENGVIVSAFALSGSHDGADCVQWRDGQGAAMYLDRLGVDAGHARRGFGRRALALASAIARERGARFLRLFVVDRNRPAINFYEKNGFVRVDGRYEEVVDETLTLCEFGFELVL